MIDKKKKKGFALLMQWAGKNKNYIYLAVFLALLSSLCGIIPYFVFYKLIDFSVSGTLDIEHGLKLALGLIAFTLIRVVLNGAATLASHKGAYNTLYEVRCMVTDHMAKMPMGALNERSIGEIKCVMNESIEKLELFLAHNLPELVLYMSGPFVIFIWLLTINRGLALLSIAPLIFVVAVMILMFARFFTFMDEINASGSKLSGTVSEYVSGMRLIKAYNMSVSSFKKYAEAIEGQFSMWKAISKATGPLYAMYIVFLECGILFLVPAGGWLFVNGKITAGVLLLFAFIGTQYLMDIRPLQELSNNLSFALNGVNQVKEILDVPIFEGGREFPKEHDITLSDVSFSYDGKTEILKGVNLQIKEGEKIAVVGASGGGKSTLIQLIARFYDVTNGEVKIGGVNVKDIKYDDLLCNISVIFQSAFLTRGSVFENIAMGKKASLDEVRKAARAAQIDDFIMSLPEGYETKVGNFGGRFSGGQKQRICIARAILKNAPILILDEATSAADPENQVEIDKAIANLCNGKTVIIVAHRLGITKDCDRIAVVEKGTVTDVAPHKDLLTKNDYFRKSWEDYTAARNIKYSAKGGQQ
ncbi:ATP-binding cassette, subfamily B [Butyrivibrio fibrisolvens]|uniref:ATP-binding cassette, subfamily B n=1 Tax=Butyrivibrio fibrisolvens TaxID=831 RepID=A0A1H9V6I2_BUTFI|nr:ABC transporter ATP-binding protein [Butyrivibrio fibrisolvens]SES17282.1 ATP-binding cassette, subfamily B [Butyrivibrio fibrisolvens]